MYTLPSTVYCENAEGRTLNLQQFSINNNFTKKLFSDSQTQLFKNFTEGQHNNFIFWLNAIFAANYQLMDCLEG